jgi:hypothetical protein
MGTDDHGWEKREERIEQVLNSVGFIKTINHLSQAI